MPYACDVIVDMQQHSQWGAGRERKGSISGWFMSLQRKKKSSSSAQGNSFRSGNVSRSEWNLYTMQRATSTMVKKYIFFILLVFKLNLLCVFDETADLYSSLKIRIGRSKDRHVVVCKQIRIN